MTEKHLVDTEFFAELMAGVYGPRKGGARIIADAEDASTGSGKTSGAVALAEFLSYIFDYDFSDDDHMLSGAQYLRRWREHLGKEQPSVIVVDELAGAGAGDARRAMSNQNVDLGSLWQMMRTKRIVTITTLPHWGDVDVRMRRFADFRLHMKRRPIGYFVPYRIGAKFDDGKTMTHRLGEDGERISFPNLHAHGDAFYERLSERKDELLNSGVFDADSMHDSEDEETIDPEEAERQAYIDVAQRQRELGKSCREVAETLPFSKSWVSDNTTDPGASA